MVSPTLDRPAAISTVRQGFAKALALFHETARRVPAYKHFLKKAGIKHEQIRTKSDFDQVPLTDKTNYITQYSLEDLSWDGTLESWRYVSTSSGSTGIPFFWPRGLRQDAVVGMMVRRVFEDIFDCKKGSTLFVDSFALGTWIAGLEFYNAAKWTADAGNRIVIVTPGIDKTEAINQIKRLAPSFDRVVLGGYPPFIKDIIEQGTISGISWPKIDLRLLFAGESVSVSWRNRVLELIGQKNNMRASVNIYGMADSGIVANDTPIACLLRRHLPDKHTDASLLPAQSEVLGLYQYHPTERFFQVLDDSSIILTSNAGLPLIRYDTRDSGGIIPYETGLEAGGPSLAKDIKRHKIDVRKWRLPFIYLYGRKDLSISLYALNIYVENIKRALETTEHRTLLSGLFTMEVGHTENLDQQFQITIELSRNSEPSASLIDALTKDVVRNLCKVNSEYAKLRSVIGDRAIPKITLVRYGELDTIRGRKHKWVKRK